MNKDALAKRLMATYVDELDDQVRALNRGLLELEKTPPGPAQAESLKTLLRAAHSLKGASRSVNVGVIEAACHQLESVFAALQSGKLALGDKLFGELFAAADAIEQAGKRLRRQENTAGEALDAVLPRLESLAAGRGLQETDIRLQQLADPAVEPASAAPAQAPLGSATISREESPLAPAEPELFASTVRVSADKLDALLTECGEFLAAEERLRHHVEDLKSFSSFVIRWRAERSAAIGPLLAARRSPRSDRNKAFNLSNAETRRLLKLYDQTAENLEHLQRESTRLFAELIADTRHLRRAADALTGEIRRVRMLPFEEACLGLDRMLRDLARQAGKEVELVLDGADVELDRSVLAGLKDTLRHLVRNAVHHGVETPAERRAAGKPSCATISITAALHGALVEIAVADDGRGLDLEALRAVLQKKRLELPAAEHDLARMIFLPGVTTEKFATGVSGRGVGLDIVKSRAEEEHGAVDVTFAAGRGTCIRVTMPFKLTAFRALLVTAGGQAFGFVDASVDRVGRIELAALKRIDGREMLRLDGEFVPVASLARLLGLRRREPPANGKFVPYLLITAGGRRLALLVAEHLAEQEITQKKLNSRMRPVPHVAGAAILPSGRIALILNAASLIRAAAETTGGLTTAPEPPPRKRLLLAEDSVTTRTLLASVLEEAGYDVAAVPDGAAAWEQLQQRDADLVVSDVAMPRMDGFALTEAVRSSSRFHELPVVLVTARETEEDKARGAAVGANAYLIKSAFDQQSLLETIAQLL